MSSRPMVFFAGGDQDADFVYASGFRQEQALYCKFADGDDVIVVSQMEADRARQQSRARQVLVMTDLGWDYERDSYQNWGSVAARVLGERGLTEAVLPAHTRVGYFQALEAAGIKAVVDAELLTSARRRKSAEESAAIHAAQRAAEAACVEVIGMLGTADVRDGVLWFDGRPLTSERLMAAAESTLSEIGYRTPDLIVAGSPGSAMPHFTGEGPIAASGPVIIDIFPQGKNSGYYGDLTRTVVVGDVPAEVQAMHTAVVAALEAAMAEIRPGANGRDASRRAAQVLVEHGFATRIKGLEGRAGAPEMNHSLGHGVGLEVHEAPTLRDADVELVEGDVVTVEPGLYLAGLGGVRVEDTGIVTKDGFRNFSTISRSLDPRAYL